MRLLWSQSEPWGRIVGSHQASSYNGETFQIRDLPRWSASSSGLLEKKPRSEKPRLIGSKIAPIRKASTDREWNWSRAEDFWLIGNENPPERETVRLISNAINVKWPFRAKLNLHAISSGFHSLHILWICEFAMAFSEWPQNWRNHHFRFLCCCEKVGHRRVTSWKKKHVIN